MNTALPRSRLLTRRTVCRLILGHVAAVPSFGFGLSAIAEPMADGVATSVTRFGADPNGVGESAAAINAAIDSVAAAGGGVVHLPAGTYALAAPVVLKRGVLLEGAARGQTVLRLQANANCNVVESHRYSALLAKKAYETEDDPEYTVDYGLSRIVLDGNGDNQDTAGLLYGARLYGRRLTLRDVLIANVKGVGLLTASRGRHDGDTYDWTDAKMPNEINGLQIINSREEGWINDGMTDLWVHRVVANRVGDRRNDGTDPQRSTTYGHLDGPAGEVHGIRIENGGLAGGYFNINGVRFGRGLYIADGNRVMLSHAIASGCWGNFYFGSNCYGWVNLLSQANPSAWPLREPVAHAHIHNLSDDIQFAAVTIRRIKGQDTAAPGILEEGGAIWSNVRVRQGRRVPGHAIVFGSNGASNAQFTACDIKGVGGTAAARYDTAGGIVRDGGESAAIVINGGTDLAIRARLGRNARGIVNTRSNLVAHFDVIIDFDSATDTALEGFTAAPAIAGVTAGRGQLAEPSLRASTIVLRDGTTGKTFDNRFSGEAPVPWDATSTAPQSATIPHQMWRQPAPAEVKPTLFCGGSDCPRIDYFLVSHIDTAAVTLALRLGEPLNRPVATGWGVSIN